MLELALLQAALPLAMALWLIVGRPPSRADLLLRVGAAWTLLFGVALAGLWLALPLATVPLLAALLVGASVAGSARLDPKPAGSGLRSIGRWAGRLAAAAGLSTGLWLAVPAAAGQIAPAGAVDLAFPFESGRYLVANGGSTGRVNGHFMTLGPRYARWRGESYAVDLIRIDALGFRTRERRLLSSPSDPRRYLTFGQPVVSPCSGRVEEAVQDRPDMPVPVRDRRNLEGNFVRLRCGAYVVLIAHFARGAVRVSAGQQVAVGTPLGLVGNSGNSDEPHLHIHVQRPGPASAPLSGDPLFVTFGGRFLARNRVVVAD
jgi:hypothetical protein